MEISAGHTNDDRPNSDALQNSSDMPQRKYTALIMAGQRPGENELVRDTGAPHRSFVDILGEPMLERVVLTLEEVDHENRALKVQLDLH